MIISRTTLNRALSEPKAEVMNFLNEIANKYPDAISFAPGRPREEHFDVASVGEYLATYIGYQAEKNAVALDECYASLGQYGRTNGVIGDLIATMLHKDEGIDVCGDDVVVTVGCQEAMCLCLLALCGNPGDVALVVDPAYIGIAGAAKLLGIELAAVRSTRTGIDLDDLQTRMRLLRAEGKKPRALYLSPDAANPTGWTMDEASRRRLLELTEHENIVILEDHAYNYFQYDAAKLMPLKAMANSDHVIYLGSFSKSIFPGLRLGFLATTMRTIGSGRSTSALSHEISKIKSMLTVNTSPICQAIAGGILLKNGCSLQIFTEKRRNQIMKNRDTMLSALERNFSKTQDWCAAIEWNIPSGGFFLSLSLPFLVSDDDLLLSAERYHVLWTPMSYFSLNEEASNQIRLSFSYVTAEQIELGISALATMIRTKIVDNNNI